MPLWSCIRPGLRTPLLKPGRARRRQILARDREDEAVVEDGYEGSQVNGAA